MSLLDRVRATAGRESPDPTTEPHLHDPRTRVRGAGLLIAGIGWLVVVLLATLAWSLAPTSTTGWPQTLSVGSALWLLSTGVPMSVEGSMIGIVPLLAWGLQVWLCHVAIGRVRGTSALWRVGADLAIGYAVVVVLAAALAWIGPAHPVLWRLPVALSAPAIALAIHALRQPTAPDLLPPWAQRAVRPAAEGLGALGVLSVVLVVAALLARWGTVSSLYAAVGAGLAGGVVLTIAQLLFLPNLAGWALAFLAGPGFAPVEGAAVTVSGAKGGLLPLVPVLGAIPGDAHYPGWLTLAILLPVAVGAWVGRSASRSWTRLAKMSHKLRTAAVSCAVVALGCGLLLALGGSAAGSARLSQIGPDPVVVTGALLVELAVGAGLWLVGERTVARFLR